MKQPYTSHGKRVSKLKQIEPVSQHAHQARQQWNHGDMNLRRSPAYSQYAFVKAYLNQKAESRSKRISRCLNSLAALHRCLFLITVLRESFEKCWHTTTPNTTYREMAEYYNIAIIPVSVWILKDKPNATDSVYFLGKKSHCCCHCTFQTGCEAFSLETGRDL